MKKLSLEVIEYLGRNDNMNEYKVCLKYGKRQYTLPFFMGIGLSGEPQVKEVVSCLLLDRMAYENARDVEDFMNEFGYEDYREAKRIYNDCAKHGRNIERLFGDDLELIEKQYENY